MDLCQWPEAVLLLVLVEPGLECRCHSSESSPSPLSCPRGHVELPGDGRGWRGRSLGRGREPGGRAGGQEGGQPCGPQGEKQERLWALCGVEQTEQVGDSLCPGCWGAGSGAEQSTGPLCWTPGWPTRPGRPGPEYGPSSWSLMSCFVGGLWGVRVGHDRARG